MNTEFSGFPLATRLTVEFGKSLQSVYEICVTEYDEDNDVPAIKDYTLDEAR